MKPAKSLILTLATLSPLSSLVAAEDAHISTAPDILFHIGPLPVTNSMVTCWVIALLLIIVIRLAIRKPRLLPGKGQLVIESIFQAIINVTKPIVGNQVAPKVFPLLVVMFVFILSQNWAGLLPGVGSITYNGAPLIRAGTADLNATAALAIIAMCAWLYFIMRYAGPKFVIKDWFGNKADKTSIPALIYYALFPIFIAVGFIEIISIVFRPVSLSFRLFGNVFGGENLIHAMAGIFWWLPIPFYFLELLIGLIQAFVFTLLVAVYIGLITKHTDESHDLSAH